MKNSIGTVSGATVAVSSDKVTVTFTSAVESFTVAKLTAQVRLDNLTVEYSAGCSYNINYTTNNKADGAGGTWSEGNCFEQVGSTTEWRYEMTLPGAGGSFWVGNGAWVNNKSEVQSLSNITFVGLQGTSCGTKPYPGEGAIGYVRIYSNSGDKNYYAAFQPTYQIAFGIENQTWQHKPFALVSGNTYETEQIDIPSDFSASYKYYVGPKKSDGTVWVDGKSSTDAMNTMGGMSDVNAVKGSKGIFRIYDNSCDNNWYCSFIPYYNYKLLKDDESVFYTSAYVSSEAANKATTIYSTKPTKKGHTFVGWSRTQNATTADVKAGDSYTYWKANDTFYPVWKKDTYTITSTLTNCSSDPEIPSSYTYTGSAANLTYTITPSTGYALPDAVTVSGTTYTWDKATGKLTLTGTISSNVTITVTAKKVYTITWKVNKQTYTEGTPTQTVYEGSTYKNLTLPTAPADGTLDECYTGKKFVGWSTENIGSTESDVPSILFKTAAEAPSTEITANTTLYAVFATETTNSSETTTEQTASLSFASTDQRTSYTTNKQVWSQNGITLTNDKSSSTSSVGDYSNPARFYKSSKITIEFTDKITQIVFVCSSSDYATELKNSIKSGATVTTNGSSVTAVLTTPATSFIITSLSGQVRMSSLEVAYKTTTTSSAPSYSDYVTECCTLNNITLDGSGTVTGGKFSASAAKACKGEEITLTATAAECYEFMSWTIKKTSDGTDVTSSVLNGNTLTMPDYAVTVSATFKSLSVTEIALAMTGGHQNLDVGQTNQLLVTYTPADATCDNAIVSWTSSDDNVMSVSNSGLVTALRAGNATITATTEGGVTATYTITVNNPACVSWYLHYWNQTTGGDECFYKVKPDDPNDHEWRTNNFSLPSNSDEDKFIVNNTPEDQYKTDQIFRTGIGFADIQRGGQNCGTNPYPGQDAYGQLSIYDDSNTPNRYIAFYPAQYLVTYSKEGAASWEVLPFKNTTGYEYETEPFMVPNGYKTDADYKYYVGIINHHGNIMHVTDKSSVDAMNTVSGLSANDMAGKWGTWHIYSNSCDANWYCEFISYYRVDFNLNGGEGDFAPRYGKTTTPYVTFTTTDIGAPTRTGYTFLGWKDQNNKIYAPTGATVTINKDLTLTALWIEEYPSNNCRWEEVTINDIEYGDEVVIATVKNGATYALKDNDGGTSSAPLAVKLTINSNKTINTSETPISTPLIWNIDYDKADTKNLVIYSTKNAGKWLYSINANDGVRIGTNTNKEFKIVEGTGNDAGNIFLYHVAQNRYLGVYYQGPDWRGYTSINSTITGQTLKFYKKVCLPSNLSRVTYSVGAGDTAPEEQEVENNTSITLPSITTTLTCVNFVGWTDAASGYTHGTDNLYKAGDSYTVTENVTLHAVYAAGGGYVLVEDVTTLTSGMQVIIANTDNGVAMGVQKSNNRGEVSVTISDKTLTPADGVEIFMLEEGTTDGTFAFKTSAGYLYAASSNSNYLKTQATNDANGSWMITIEDGVASIIAQGSNTRKMMQYNSSSSLFACYATTTTNQNPVNLYAQSISNYTTTPACVTYKVTTCTPINGTISVDKTTVDPYGSATVTFAPASRYMLQAVTVTSGTATVGSPSYTTSQISDGTVTISNIQSDIEVCATFVEIPYYKVTFVDVNDGSSTQIVSQSGFGADITAPTTASAGCDATWTFVGWAPSNSLTGATEEPDGLVAPGGTISGSLITSNDLTYYSVYSNSSDGTPPFSIGKSGTYYFKVIKEDASVLYATNALNSSSKYPTNSTPNIPFLLVYNSTKGKYTIKNTLTNKYLQPDSYDMNKLAEDDASYDWNIVNAVSDNSKTGEFLFTYLNSNSNTRYLYCDGSNFGSWSKDNSKYALYLEPASEMRYYNASSCTELVTMTFDVPADAELSYETGYPEGYYKDSEKKEISTFPTLTYEGWAFVGWTAGASYNDQIGDENLDDENSSSESPSATIYKTGGTTSYNLVADVTMYPIFTKYDDNEDVDLVNGGEFYMYFYREVGYYEDEYFVADNHYQRMYASSAALNSGAFSYTTSCSNAQIFEFTKKGDGWNIRLKNADGTYPAKSYLVNTIENDYAVQSAEPSYTWGVIKNPGGDYLMWYRGNSQNTDENNPHFRAKAREHGGTSWSFKCYNKDNDASNFYYEVYLGTCEDRVFSSNPSNKPKITLNGTPVVTSTKDQSIRSKKSLSLSAVKLAANGTITLTSDNADVYFSTDKAANFSKVTKPASTLTINADANGKLVLTTVYVHYKPTEESTLGIQTVTVTATTGTEGQPDYATATTTASVRNLPAKFVIATKVGANWYALPANMSGATNPEGVLIEVDETTMTATAPNTTSYTLFPVKTTNSSGDRYEEYGDRVRFSAVNNESKGLWTSSTESTIRNYAVIDEVTDGSSDDSYEWKITTTVVDGNWQYTLQTDQEKNQKYLRYWTGATGSPKWGTYAAGNDQLYFLPVTETEPFEYQVVEWYPTKMLIQTDAAISNPTAKIGDATINNVTCTNKGGKLYEIAGLPLANNPTKVLTIKFSNYTNTKAIPVIISRSETTISSEPFKTLTKDVYNYSDLVVRDGATLTIDGGTLAENTFFDVTIYPTSKISVPEGKKLTVHSLTFFGGIDEIYNGSNYTLNKYGVPELSLKGSLKKSISTIAYLMRVDSKQMYSLTVPYDVQLADIKYWDGTNIVLGDELWVSAYDGESRAKKSKKNWIYETDFESKLGAATLKAGVGYTISAEMQAGVGNEYSILRMPMTSNVANEGTEAAKSVAVTAHGIDTEVSDNHKGWNLVGNPYMTSITGADDTDLVLGYLKETGTGPWEWVNDELRYVTIPADNGKDYHQQKFTEAVLPPFKNFFVQIGTTGDLQFGLSTRQNMPARSVQAAAEKEVEFEILLSNDVQQDNTGLLISEDYSPAYEINADLEKMTGSMSIYTIYGGYKLAYNALSPINASEWIPMGYIAPSAGEYTFRLDDVDKIMEQVEHIYLIDYTTNTVTDLMVDEYSFTTAVGSNDTRFVINIILNSRDNTATGFDNIKGDDDQPIKFIYQDEMYIHNNGIIYDATGKQVTTINK